MKNHIVFKFLAIVLCAACLLGAVGSGLGILVLTQGNLYNKTVDQLIEERINSEGSRIAHNLASRYASVTLGGTPENLASQRFPNYAGFIGSYEYSITDSEGTVLEGLDTIPQGNKVYTFPTSGQYIHLVSTMTEAEKYPQETSEPHSVHVNEGDYYLYDALPPEGAVIKTLYFSRSDNNGYEYTDASGIGIAYYTSDGTMVCLFTDPQIDFPTSTMVTEVVLLDANDQLIYQAVSDDGVGYFTYTSSGIDLQFVSTIVEEEQIHETTEVEETIPESVPETIPETIPETVPETTPETTVPEIDFNLVDNIPEEKSAEVAKLKATFKDGTAYEHSDEGGMGRLRHNNVGKVEFSSYDPLDFDYGAIVALEVIFWDSEGAIVLEASCPDGLGEFYKTEDGALAFISNFPETAPAETVPEETTVEETTAETEATEVTEETTSTEETASAEETSATEETVSATEPEETTDVTIPEEPEPTEPILINGKPLEEFEINSGEYYDSETDQHMYAQYVYTPMPEYTVNLYLSEKSLTDSEAYDILRIVRQYRNYLLPVMAGCILAFIVFAIFLCCTAGRKPKSDEVRAGALNRIPLDLYFLLGVSAVIGLSIGAVEGGNVLLRQNMLMGCSFAIGCAYVACLLTVGFLFAIAAQVKTPDGFWYRNTLCGHCIRLFTRFALWLEKAMAEKGFPFLGQFFKKLWVLTCAAAVWLYCTTEKVLRWVGETLGRFFRWIGNKIHRFLALLPVTWQWIIMGSVLVFSLLITIAGRFDFGIILSVIFALALVLYGSHCFGILWESTKRMSKGDLDTKVDDKLMVGAFKDFAEDLNDLAGVAVIAAQKQLKSERMKTELITNVSHDIKTPLTSIINYVDLLQKPHTEEEEQQYLEVLDRQSQRLKKLIEDLMDMSKANTGNMSVEITQVDGVESVNQALGEFADKLDKAQVIPVFRHTEVSVPMMADGRLVWRVLSNLLGNAVKYAMPGTRLYVDLTQVDDKVIISLKNISREELNVSAEELMERFVRGDDSRNTEGSGLGLNIAKSLMELQKGQLELLVDGDLFKVTLIFPGV